MLPAAAGQIILSFLLLSHVLILFLTSKVSKIRFISFKIKTHNFYSYVFAFSLFVFAIFYAINSGILNHFFTVFRTIFLSTDFLIDNSSASYKLSGLLFICFSFLHPLDFCVQKANMIYYYPDVLSSWTSFSDLFFTQVGFGSYLYSTFGNILVDFTSLGTLFFIFLFVCVYCKVMAFRHVSLPLRLSCIWYIFIAAFSVAGFAFWPSWFVLGFIFNKNCHLIPPSLSPLKS